MQQSAEIDPDQTFICLRQDLLRPGDVLLVRNSGIEGRGIALAHKSRFTHAALFVHRGRLFEADGFGVGAACPAVCHSAHDGGPVVVLPDCRNAAVYRHPGLVGVEPGSTREADLALMLEAIVSRKVQPYSRLGRLSKAAGPVEPLASVVLEAMDFHEALHQSRGSARRKHDEGRFCSEIVCEVLEELGYPAFGDGRAHADVGPGNLTEAGLVELTSHVVVERRANQLAGAPQHTHHVAGVIDAYYEARAVVSLLVEQELAARREGEMAVPVMDGGEGPGSRMDALRERVDRYRQVADDIHRSAGAFRLERHAQAAADLRELLSRVQGGDDSVRARVRQATRDLARLARDYELLRIRAAAHALRRVGDEVESQRLLRRAAAIEAWAGSRNR